MLTTELPIDQAVQSMIRDLNLYKKVEVKLSYKGIVYLIHGYSDNTERTIKLITEIINNF